MKVYIVSGLGADFKVLDHIEFPENLEVVFLDWLMPNKNEEFHHYILRMAERVDDSQDFYLLGYSFGGIVVQEINKIKSALKVVILGSIKSDKEKSKLMKFGEFSKIPKYVPVMLYGNKPGMLYSVFRKLIDPKNPKVMQYFRVRDPYYLKWSIEKIAEWKFEENPEVIQILADKDIVFPIKNSHPDFVIKGATHLFPATRPKEVSAILKHVFGDDGL